MTLSKFEKSEKNGTLLFEDNEPEKPSNMWVWGIVGIALIVCILILTKLANGKSTD